MDFIFSILRNDFEVLRARQSNPLICRCFLDLASREFLERKGIKKPRNAL
jgi:hypothetical protein